MIENIMLIYATKAGESMLELSGFRIIENIGSNSEIQLHRVVRELDKVVMIVKTTSDAYVGASAINAFQEEYNQLLRLQGRGGLVPYSLEIVGERPVMLLQDYNGTTLDKVLNVRRASLQFSELLDVAIAIVNCISDLHNADLTVHELIPFYLLVREDLQEIKLIDFRASLIKNNQGPLMPSMKNTDNIIPYMSPEQTGRTGLVPDYRTDIYSLGVILYEWFARSLPFQSNHILDIVYHHLATTPEPLHVRNQSIPRIVSDIVHKCIEKMPEKRYVSAYGILSDLKECLVRYRVSGKVQPFTLAQQDISKKALLSEGMFGRQIEQQSIVQALQRVLEGSAEVVWISGNAGIGKTVLVQETIRKTVPFKVYFAIGTSEYASSALPYHIWAQVIEQLVSSLLTLNRLQSEVWKLKIIDAMQGDGQLLIELVPRLALLIGEQPVIDELAPAESQYRFHLTMTRFIQLFCEHDQPLVLFFDDFQWLDEASLHFLYYLFENSEMHHMLIVGAYREEEISADRLKRLRQLEKQGTATEWISLMPFDVQQLQNILTHMLPGATAEIYEFAELTLQKTEGNPLFLRQFLQDLLERKLISYDERSRVWKWDVLHIADLSVHENVAATLTHSLKKLPSEMVNILGRAALFGNQFDLKTLSIVTGFTIEQLLEWANGAVQNRLLQVVHGEYNTYRFQHYDIERAAIELISASDRDALHADIGDILVQRLKAGETVQVADVLSHWNQAVEHVVFKGKKLDLVELNLRAGVEAKQLLAFETALTYFRMATDLLAEDGWDSDYLLTYQAFKERAEMEVLCAQFITANDLFRLLLKKAATDLDKAQICIHMIQLEMNQDRYSEVIALGEQALKLLGYRYHYFPNKLELLRQLIKVRWKLRKHPIESFADLPIMTDERHKAAMMVLAYTSDASYALNKEGWFYSILTMLELTMNYGLIPEAAQAFASYALVLNYKFYDYESSYKWGVLACNVARSKPGLYVQAYTSFTVCYDSWRIYEPDFLSKYNDQADQAAIQSGDLWSANYSMLVNCGVLFLLGHPLNDIYIRLLSHVPKFQQNNNSLHWKQATILAQLISSLTGYSASNDPFAAADIEANSFLEEAIYDSEQFLTELIYVNQYITGYLFGDMKQALHAIEQCFIIVRSRNEEIMDSSSHYYYYILVLKEIYEAGSPQEKADYMRKIRLCTSKLSYMARRSPHNYLHKYMLAKAELARLMLKHRQAEQYYERALDAARTYGHIHDHGIIAECFARYGLHNGKLFIAKLYMNEAYDAYLQWGALLKTADMETTVGHLLNVKGKTDLERVDYLAVAMSTQVLTGEMKMDQLLHTLMGIMMQNAGAEYGALIFEHEEQWFIEVYGTLEELQIESVSLDDAGHLVPTEIIGYAARTKEEIVFHDVTSSVMFEKSEYSKKKELKSVLCLPIMHQNKLLGVLYMENNLSAGVFSKERVDVLKLLSSQCAISITNAKLYAEMQDLKNSLEDQVVERTRALEKSMQATSDALAETTVYAERNRIAQEIHDIVGHTLTSTILQIEAGKRLLLKDMDSAVIRLKEAQDLVRHSLNEIRNSVHMLKEDKYYEIDTALMNLIETTAHSTGAVIHTSIDPVSHVSFIVKKVIYHALQEGLTNGIRHGNSSEFHFSLNDNGSMLQFRLADNGIGSDNIVMGFGLKMMRDRVQQLKGTLYIDSEVDKGCLLIINLPYEKS